MKQDQIQDTLPTIVDVETPELETIRLAANLWEGFEKQKQWLHNQPRLTKIIDHAITHMRFEIILCAQRARHPRKLKLVHDND